MKHKHLFNKREEHKKVAIKKERREKEGREKREREGRREKEKEEKGEGRKGERKRRKEGRKEEELAILSKKTRRRERKDKSYLSLLIFSLYFIHSFFPLFCYFFPWLATTMEQNRGNRV